ncbi:MULTISPECIES: acyltransferase family protein [unclassified Sphingobacterium]|uniref:acyltransferase family protein n=1 Tax=unclassified Sphingobacterium TaxID=2609468 RepID=UPI0025F4213D|nr:MULTISPECIES: acyltransferase [unclassified Sphingobacterium]
MANNVSSKSEIKSLTGVRGIAALIVAIHHFISKYYIDQIADNSNNVLFGSYIYNYANHGYLMVELFFILSGFVLAIAYDNKLESGIDKGIYRMFMLKRFNRVYPLYFFSTIVYFFLFNLDKIKHIEVLIANFFFLELWLPKNFSLNNVSWSLCTEWFLYLLFPFMLIKKNLFKDRIILLFIIGIIVFILAPVLNTQKLYDDNVDFSIFELRMSNGTGALLRCLGSYIIGIAIYLIYKSKPSVTNVLNKYWYILVLFIFIFYGLEKSDIIIDILFGLLILVLTQKNSISSFFSWKPLYFLGLISYSIYLNHMIFLRFLIFSFKKGLWQESSTNVMIGFLIFIFFTILSSWFTYKFIEIPCSNWLNKKIKK